MLRHFLTHFFDFLEIWRQVNSLLLEHLTVYSIIQSPNSSVGVSFYCELSSYEEKNKVLRIKK